MRTKRIWGRISPDGAEPWASASHPDTADSSSHIPHRLSITCQTEPSFAWHGTVPICVGYGSIQRQKHCQGSIVGKSHMWTFVRKSQRLFEGNIHAICSPIWRTKTFPKSFLRLHLFFVHFNPKRFSRRWVTWFGQVNWNSWFVYPTEPLKLSSQPGEYHQANGGRQSAPEHASNGNSKSAVHGRLRIQDSLRNW